MLKKDFRFYPSRDQSYVEIRKVGEEFRSIVNEELLLDKVLQNEKEIFCLFKQRHHRCFVKIFEVGVITFMPPVKEVGIKFSLLIADSFILDEFIEKQVAL